MKNILLLLCLFFLVQLTYAQDPADRFKTNLIPPSPTAANLAKYGDVPVTLYMGQANISVPVFTVEGKDLSLPISLSYNYNGMRPSDPISWVGLGWSLQAGGVITTNVRGLPDGTAVYGKNYEDIMDSLTTVSGLSKEKLNSIYNYADYDLEPDLYSFNFDGHSGKFIQVKGKFYCFPANKFKIEGTPFNGFIITTENGTRYVFSESEITRQKHSPGDLLFSDYISAWYLTSITNAAGTEQITLNYVAEGKLSQSGILQQTYTKYVDIGNPSDPHLQTQLFPMVGGMPTTVNCLRLASIVSDKYKVTFGAETAGREDMSVLFNSFYALKDIKIENREHGLIKKFALNHGYFEGDGSSKYLKLLSVAEFEASISPTDSLVHSFAYAEDHMFPMGSQSNGLDHYGYYNRNGWSTLIPDKVVQGTDTTYIMVGGANREPSFIYAELGALKKIYYPTGGYTEFEYENNQMDAHNYDPVTLKPNLVDGNGIRIKKIINHPLIGPPITKSYQYEGGQGLQPTYMSKALREYIPVGTGVYYWLNHIQWTSTIAEGQDVGTPYFYRKVTEDIGTNADSIIRSVYRFEDCNSEASYASIKMVEKMDYKNTAGTFTPKHKTSYVYGTLVTDYFRGAKMPYKETLNEPYEFTEYKYDAYFLRSGWDQLKTVIETSYENDSLKTTEENIYDNTTHNLFLTYRSSSDGLLKIKKFKYPEDYATATEMKLAARNIVSPIETQEWIKRGPLDSLFLDGLITQYDTLSFKPIKIYALANATPLTALDMETRDGYRKYSALVSDSHYEHKMDYTYDGDGKMIIQKKESSIPVSYKWGYEAIDTNGGSYSSATNHPIAECKNATVAEFFVENFEENSAATSIGEPHTGLKYYNGSYTVSFTVPNARAYVISYWYLSGGKWLLKPDQPYTTTSLTLSGGTAYDDIRIHPADAEITTYTYTTGKGLTSIIDAKGLTSYFEYDNFNRLLNIRDANANIIKNYKYHYTNTSPIWTNTGIAYCVTDINGNNTGEQRITQTDLNPASATYATTRIFSLGTSGSCPTPAFAKLMLVSSSSSTTGTYTITSSFYKVQLFSDMAATIPYVATANTTVNYKVATVTSFGSGAPIVYYDYNRTAIILSGASSSAAFEVIGGCSPPAGEFLTINTKKDTPALKSAMAQKFADKATLLMQQRGEPPPDDGGDDGPVPSSTCTDYILNILTGTGYIP